jgi:hypothetical protein
MRFAELEDGDVTEPISMCSIARARSCRQSGASILLLATLMGWGCTGYEPASDVLEESVNLSLDEHWSCLGTAREPAKVPVFSETVDRVVYSIQVVDLSTGQIYSDARIRACGVADINCENPVTDTLSVDAEGWVDIPLFRDFTGFLEVTSSEAVPYIFYLNEPLGQSMVEYPLALISLASLGPLVGLLGVDYRPGTGVIAVRAFDCRGDTASGVALSTENEGVRWYFADGLPTSKGTRTDADGLSGLVNVQPGLAVVDVTAPNGVSIGGRQSVVVRPNWLSAVYVKPGTRPAAAQ